jgi:hypothetical protein
MTSAVGYTFYEKVAGYESPENKRMPSLPQIPRISKTILINGGAGIPSETSGMGEMVKDKNGIPLWTAHGVVTSISDQDYELLRTNVVYKKHEEKGYVRCVENDIRGNNKAILKEVKQMAEHDQFAQLNNETFKSNMKMKIESADKNSTFDNIPRN